MNSQTVSEAAKAITQELDRVIVGKHESNQNCVLVLFCAGHLLIEDVPGVGKTTLAKAIAKLVGGDFKRIQFTPDLLPSDVTGTSIFNQQSREFEFLPGPVFSNVVLADEVNRATPKTQSSLLEAMEEHQVTTDGIERKLPEPFFVLATQNNVEMMGTFPLPEAQLDRFFGRITLGYPDRDAEARMLSDQQVTHPIHSIQSVIQPAELVVIQQYVRTIHVDETVRGYIVDIVRSTRDHSQTALGASPRASLHLLLASQAHAAVQGRDFVIPDDVKAVAMLVLPHRLIARGEARAASEGAIAVVQSILERVPAPIPAR